MKRGPGDPGLWPEDILIGLGSNMGQRLGHLQQGIAALDKHKNIEVLCVSSLYESEFVGVGEQDPFFNSCLMLRTTLSPLELLHVLKEIEEGRGRAPSSHMQPRPLDLDILFFGQRHFQTEALTIPHPRMQARGFVMQPLVELVPKKRFPDSRETVARVCARLRKEDEYRLLARDDLSLIPPIPDHKED